MIPERVFLAYHPQPNASAKLCAEKLPAVALAGELPVDWDEVERIAASPAYRVSRELQELKQLVLAKEKEKD